MRRNLTLLKPVSDVLEGRKPLQPVRYERKSSFRKATRTLVLIYFLPPLFFVTPPLVFFFPAVNGWFLLPVAFGIGFFLSWNATCESNRVLPSFLCTITLSGPGCSFDSFFFNGAWKDVPFPLVGSALASDLRKPEPGLGYPRSFCPL